MAHVRAGVGIGDGSTAGGSGLPRIDGSRNAHVLSWQSKVGFLPWMGPSTASVIAGLGAQGHKHVLAVSARAHLL